MKKFEINRQQLGILGGGQLGKMLCQAASRWQLPIHILDKDATFPAAQIATNFVAGNFKDYDDVVQFGKTVDVLSIEIEHVNTAALHHLKKEGLEIHPAPEALDIIKDKGLQKQFYEKRELPTSEFTLFDTETSIQSAIQNGQLAFPFVQKSRTAGYDGQGVAVIKDVSDLSKLMDTASLVEPLVDIDKELAVIVARNAAGQIASYPVVEMTFDPEANLVDCLLCPARISSDIEAQATALARRVMEAFDICGLLAVEFFLDKTGKLLINEVAPRTHNSGHHTIEACETSQFEQQLRAVLNFPLGSTKLTSPAVMVNLLGAEGFSGPVIYQGLEDCLAIPGVHLHLYGKTTTRPFRKMGHATIVDMDIDKALEKAKIIQKTLKIIA